MKTIWRSQHAFVAVKTDYIARTVKERGAMTALNKMLIQRSPSDGIEIVVDII
jgi:hypothetical protein